MSLDLALTAGVIPNAWMEAVEDIRKKPFYYAEIASELYYKYSKSKARVETGQRIDTIIKLIEEHPGITSPELREIIKVRNLAIDPDTLLFDLRNLSREKGSLIKEKAQGEKTWHYSIRPQEESEAPNEE